MYKYISYYLDKPIRAGRSFDVFEPDAVTKDVAIFMIHGGGWRSGSKAGFHKLKNYINTDNPPIFFMEAELEHVFIPEHTLTLAKQHRSMGIQSQWRIYDKMEHGFFYELTRNMQKQAFEDFCLFLDGNLNTDI